MTALTTAPVRSSVATSPNAAGTPLRAGAHLATAGRLIGHTVIVFATVFLFATFITFALQGLSGLSPAHLQLSESATPEQIAALEHQWGLDRPFIVQYLDWFGGILQGDLGTSMFTGLPVT